MLGIWCFICCKNENHSSLYFRKCIFPTIEFYFFFLYFKPRIYGQNTMHTRIYSQFFFLWLLFSATAYSSPEYDKWFKWFVTWSLDEWPKIRMEIMQMYHINLATISVKFKQHRLTLLVYFYYFRNWIQLIKCWLRFHCFLLHFNCFRKSHVFFWFENIWALHVQRKSHWKWSNVPMTRDLKILFFFAIYSYACLSNVYFVMYILSYMMCCVLVSLDEMLWNPIDMSQHIYTLCWIKFTGFTLKNGNQTDNGAPEMSCDIHWMCCFSNNPQPHYQNHHFNYSWAYEYFCYFIYFCADF